MAKAHWPPTDGPHRPEVSAFLNAVVAVCREHKMWLSHEDGHGAFEVQAEEKDGDTADWLLNAVDRTNG